MFMFKVRMLAGPAKAVSKDTTNLSVSFVVQTVD